MPANPEEPATLIIRHWPFCLTKMRVPDDAGGKLVTCPGCKKKFMVPLSRDQRARSKLREGLRQDHSENPTPKWLVRAIALLKMIGWAFVALLQTLFQAGEAYANRPRRGPSLLGLFIVIVLAIILAPLIWGGSQLCCLFNIIDKALGK